MSWGGYRKFWGGVNKNATHRNPGRGIKRKRGPVTPTAGIKISAQAGGQGRGKHVGKKGVRQTKRKKKKKTDGWRTNNLIKISIGAWEGKKKEPPSRLGEDDWRGERKRGAQGEQLWPGGKPGMGGGDPKPLEPRGLRLHICGINNFEGGEDERGVPLKPSVCAGTEGNKFRVRESQTGRKMRGRPRPGATLKRKKG